MPQTPHIERHFTAEPYESERAREAIEVKEKPDAEAQEVEDGLVTYGLTPEESRPVAAGAAFAIARLAS